MNGIWEEMGPWSYDPEVAMAFQVQSPGACHVYTVEQAKANHEIVWCGTGHLPVRGNQRITDSIGN
jgi:hypothetical protein